jgi:hypothetical protein
MKRPPPLVPLLAALALVRPALAAQVDLFDESAMQALVAPSAPALVHGRALVGDVTGDFLPDVLWLQGGELVLVYGPSIYRSTNDVAFAATDAVVIESEVPGEADAIVAVNGSGAWLLTGYDGGEFTSTLLSAAWAGVTRVRCGDTDGDGSHDVVGLAATGDLLLLEAVRSAAPIASTIPVSGTILDMDAIQWDGTGGDELAVLRTNGFSVLSRTGAVLANKMLSTGAGFVFVLGDAGAPQERCAIVYTVLGYQLVRVIGAQGDTVCGLGPERFFGGGAGDADGDGHDDLLLAADDSHELLLLLNRAPTTPTFAVGASTSETIAVAAGVPTTWSAWPALHDLDLDGDADILVSVEATGELGYLESDAAAKEAAQPDVVGGWYVFDEGNELGELTFHVRLPAGFPFAANHVQAIAWRHASVAYGEGEMEAQAVDIRNGGIDAQGDAFVTVAFTEELLFTPHVYYVELRAVELSSPQREVIRSGPAVVHAFTTPMSITQETSLFAAGVTVRTYVIVPPDPPFECDDDYLAERAVAPKEVETPEIPPIEVPPDPF